MSYEFKIVNPIEYPGWNELISVFPDATVFHTSNWAKVLAESYSYRPRYFCSFNGQELTGAIPVMEVNSFLTGKRGVSLPFSDFCEPLVSEGVCYHELFEKAVEYGKSVGWKYLELRGGEKYRGTDEVFGDYATHSLELYRDNERQFQGFRNSTRRNVRKALKEGVKTEISSSQEAVKGFYRLNCMTRREHGLPPQPFSFFEKVYEHIISRGLGIILLAAIGSKTISGAVYFHFGNNVLYKYGASNRAYQHVRANNLVMGEAIRWYGKRGFNAFDFGRTDLWNEGLLQFKAGWGVAEGIQKYYRFDIKSESFVKGIQGKSHSFYGIFKKMPVPLLNLIGSVSYRHVG
ncbi:MAG: GNAT family N-acetyltransferase [Candidatus Aenigmarchaeota archaeon]|nr:GNAT family N-acetyltransferase [Candidatus Aenigmarchaeota archaeon]NIS74873.1 GNAT family N-acetyltransferase [Deltaproteobacteria bacterium]